MKPILYGIITAVVLAAACTLLVAGEMTEGIFFGSLLAGLIVWGVAEIKETVYYYYKRLKEGEPEDKP